MTVKTQVRTIALLTPFLILSLATAGFAESAKAPAANEQTKDQAKEPAATSTTKSSQPRLKPGDKGYVPIMERPEMADFKRAQLFAFKYRQRLGNLETMLAQAKRVGTINDASFKKIRKDLDKLNEDEPGLARSGWKQSEVDAFENRIKKFEQDFAQSQAQNKSK